MGQWEVHRAAFFKSIFGPIVSGYACIASLQSDMQHMQERFFSWPNEQNDMFDYVEEIHRDRNVFYCPQLFRDRNFKRPSDNKGPRVKENVKICPTAWADLDNCHPDLLLVRPSITIESSPGRWQALWIFEDPIVPEDAEDISRRIAYHHVPDQADKSGWILTKLLRVPYTYNLKYDGAPVITVHEAPQKLLYRHEDFTPYPATSKRMGGGIPMPEIGHVPTIDDPIQYLQDRRRRLNAAVFRLFSDTPSTESWSEPLWSLMMYLFEGGLEREEVFAIVRLAACNKYIRDGKPERLLWDDVCRAYIKHMEDVKAVVVPELELVDLLSPDELSRVRSHNTFVERYVAWATSLGDAAPQYHQAGAFVVLSAIMSGRVSLPTSFGTIVPNLWFMLLADTTLTRKSTSMDIAVDLLLEVDSDVVLATDGSIEGLLQGLSIRPGKPSVFLRDEFAGFLEAITKKDYLAGMAETLTKLYDGKFQKRMLRREIIEIRDPVFILYAGGIRTRIQQILNLDHISSGFMPRFIFLTAESDISKVKPLGPPVVRDMQMRTNLLSEIRQIYDHYTQTVDVKVHGTGVHIAPPRKWLATLTEEAWRRFNVFETTLLEAGVKSDRPDLLTPVYARLTVSTLKAALLMAASEELSDAVTVEEIHVLHAISFAVQWRTYVIDIINGVGKTQSEREIERVHTAIRRKPGVSRSALMQQFHLTARGADSVFATLEQRGQVTANKLGKGTTYYPIGGSDA